MLTLRFLEHFVESYAVLAYTLIFLGVIIEGDIVVILGGIFSHLGSLNFFMVLWITILAGVVKSFIGYGIGVYLNRHHSHRPFLSRIEYRIGYFFPHFTERPFWSIFASRFFILGLNWFTLIYSGYKGINRKLYLKAEALSLMIWSVGILALGYFFSYAALSISHDIRKFLGLILIFFILFFFLEKIIAFVLELGGSGYTNDSSSDTIEK